MADLRRWRRIRRRRWRRPRRWRWRRRRIGGGGGGGGGRGGGGGGSAADVDQHRRKYNLSLGMQILNLFNEVPYGSPVNNLSNSSLAMSAITGESAAARQLERVRHIPARQTSTSNHQLHEQEGAPEQWLRLVSWWGEFLRERTRPKLAGGADALFQNVAEGDGLGVAGGARLAGIGWRGSRLHGGDGLGDDRWSWR